MRRWLLFFTIPLTLGVFSTAAILIGRQQLLPDRVTMLHLDICTLPCWNGITPGQTKWDDAERRIKQIFSAPRYKVVGSQGTFTIQDQASQLAFTVQLDSNDDVVISIILAFGEIYNNSQWEAIDQPIITFGELNTVWGSPHYIRVWTCYGNWIPYYNEWLDSHIVVDESDGFPDASARLTWNNRVRLIQIFVGERKTADINARRWHGYLSYKQYSYKDYGVEFGGC